MKFALVLCLILSGCVSKPMVSEEDCVQDQLDFYMDLCMESSAGFEEMSGSDAHYEGVKCAVEGIKLCEAGR